MGRKGVFLIALLSVLLHAGTARPEVVQDLHTATVPVADQSAKALAAASRDALAAVLVKVSGSRQVLVSAEIKQALSGARAQVQQYAYTRGRSPAKELMVDIEFDRNYILNLIRSAGLPLWTANRPAVLAWVIVDSADGRQFINWDSTPEEAQLLVDEFSRRGVPVQIPVFDLADLGALTMESAWRLDANALKRASTRYNVQNVLAGRLARLSSGDGAGDWSYLYEGDQSKRSATVPDLKAFFRNGVELVADKMAARYAVSPNAENSGELRMVVLGVTNYVDYAKIVGFLQNLELIEQAQVQRIWGQQVELRLQTAVDADQLATLIELNDQLAPVSVAETGPQLTYQWRQ
ncbi:MAG: DUF2066 domain-containing protein [Halioglobus sp.]|nr:DUF2066 domain-containing protein [Halioglobus sp.]